MPRISAAEPALQGQGLRHRHPLERIVPDLARCWTDQCFAGMGAADIKAVFDVMHRRVPTAIVNREIVDQPAGQEKLTRYAAQFGG